jgi:hypothetical protein
MDNEPIWHVVDADVKAGKSWTKNGLLCRSVEISRSDKRFSVLFLTALKHTFQD